MMKQYVASKKGGPFQLATAPYPTPGLDEVCIRSRAVGLNPLDWKNLYYGEMVKTWPEVFGIDAAGVVEVVGANVTALKAGDAVVSLAGHGGRAGAFQDVTTVPAHFASKKPTAWTFEQAASVPVLIVGGSSGVGSSAVQLLRLALPSATILTTNSPKHNAHVAGLGATTCIDRSNPKLVEAVKAASPDGKGVDAIIDAVAGAAGEPDLFDVLRKDGPRLYSQVFTGDKIAVPEGVVGTPVFGRMTFQTPGGMNAMSKLVDLVDEGTFKLPLQVQVVGKGLDGIGPGLEKLKAGVSGTKYVVSL
ncbi:putative alcohol dehydrogenase [Lasiosphaeria miniovina]|uniref:Alcohol dehydrogenase n=1 Tax=Lasiosphaeria miniovina TaxID=1954250 RepID=A0AA40AME7_9PEZI|nr:putative alcohol dehydrogenase [Lasiosphaeria miniovina]KAK0718479.1 putative alcohol dehydrogenase [Lasiosphaeria miniovina]